MAGPVFMPTLLRRNDAAVYVHLQVDPGSGWVQSAAIPGWRSADSHLHRLRADNSELDQERHQRCVCSATPFPPAAAQLVIQHAVFTLALH